MPENQRHHIAVVVFRNRAGEHFVRVQYCGHDQPPSKSKGNVSPRLVSRLPRALAPLGSRPRCALMSPHPSPLLQFALDALQKWSSNLNVQVLVKRDVFLIVPQCRMSV
jgi:hypothetical protein